MNMLHLKALMSGAVGDSWGLIILGSRLKLRAADGSSERLLVSSNFGFIFTGPTPTLSYTYTHRKDVSLQWEIFILAGCGCEVSRCEWLPVHTWKLKNTAKKSARV